MMSKKMKIAVVIASLFAASSALANDCGDLLYSGLTIDHKKQVRVCVFSSGGQNYIQYRFGRVSQKPEIEIIRPARDTEYTYLSAHLYDEGMIFITNGDYRYDVECEKTYYDNKPGHKAYANIIVVKNDKKVIANIKLDGNTVQSEIGWETDKYGIINADPSQRYDSEFKLASPLTP